jgi:hypothetical protein
MYLDYVTMGVLLGEAHGECGIREFLETIHKDDRSCRFVRGGVRKKRSINSTHFKTQLIKKRKKKRKEKKKAH